MDKVQVKIWVSKKTMKEFRAFIIRKTGDLKKGDLSKWAEVQIKNSMREDKQQQQHTTYDRHTMSEEEEMISTLTDLMIQIKASLWNDPVNPMDISCGNNCHEKILKTVIKKIRGSDHRTSKKWIDRMLEYGFIRKEPSNQYKILNDGHDSLDLKPKAQPKQEISTVQGWIPQGRSWEV